MGEVKSRLCLQYTADTRTRARGDQIEVAGRGRPRRPIPADFAARYAELGFSEALKDLYGANSGMIARWRDEFGRDALALARLRFRQAARTIEGRARRAGYTVARVGIGTR